MKTVLFLDLGYDGLVLLGMYSSVDFAKDAAYTYLTEQVYTGALEFVVYNVEENAPALSETREGENFTLDMQAGT